MREKIDTWSCSRCDSFGTIKNDEPPHCECDETEDYLRTRLSTLERLALEACQIGLNWTNPGSFRDSEQQARDRLHAIRTAITQGREE